MAQPRRKGRAPVTSDASLAANVAHTAATAAVVLGHFKTTLQQSGMTGAIDAYRKMTDTLINQRLWAHNHELESGEEHFRQIADEAREIHEVLTCYAQLMARLMLLPQVVEATTRLEPGVAAESANRAEQLVAWLKQRARPASATQIRTALGLSTVELTAELKQLEQSGRIVKSVSGGRELFSLPAGS